MSTHSNVDGSLKSLAQEINELNINLNTQTKSAREVMGRKLIEVRALLCIRNGEKYNGNPGADGRRPIGWGKWVEQNLSVGVRSASDWIRLAYNPQDTLAREAASLRRRRATGSHLKAQIKKIWPTLDEGERNECLDLMISLQESAAP